MKQSERDSPIPNPVAENREAFKADEEQCLQDHLETDPESLAAMSHQQLIERGGSEGLEVIMWLCMRGALSPQVRRVHRNYYHATLTGYAQVIFEDLEHPPRAGV